MNKSSTSNCVIYTRVSTDDQAKEGVSLDGQEKMCLSHAKRNNLTVQKIFREEGVSAKTMNRPQLTEMLQYVIAKESNIDTIIIWKIDRISRKALDYQLLKEKLVSQGISLVSATESFTNSAAGILGEGMVALLAEFENNVRSERVVLGMKERISKGSWLHVAPTGYSNYKDSEGRPTLSLNESSESVRELLELFSTGEYTQLQLMNKAKKDGLTSKKGNPITFNAMGKMLRNPIYAGKVKSSLTAEIMDGLHEPLITIETYHRNMQLLNPAYKLNSQKHTDSNWPLRNSFTKCAFCSLPITGGSVKGNTKRYDKYQCRQCRKSEVGVSTGIDRDKLHSEFRDLLDSISPNDEVLSIFKSKVLKAWKNRVEQLRTSKNSLQAKQDSLELKKERILDLYIEGGLSVEEKASQLSKVDAALIDVSRQLDAVSGLKNERIEILDYSLKFISNLSKIWDDSDVDAKSRLQNIVFPEGVKYEFGKGFRTPEINPIFRYVSNKKDPILEDESLMVIPKGVEPLLPD